MSAREQLRRLRDECRQHASEAAEMAAKFHERDCALTLALEQLPDEKLEGLYKSISTECPSVLPS